MGFTTSYSIMKITAQMMTAANDAFGMKKKYGVRRPRANSIRIPIKKEEINKYCKHKLMNKVKYIICTQIQFLLILKIVIFVFYALY